MVLAGQFWRASAVGLLSAAMASAGMLRRVTRSGRQWRRCACHSQSDVRLRIRSKAIAATFNTDIEVIMPDLQKIQFDSSGQLRLSRPDKVHASRTGGYTI
jgi:hypothetical protein